MSSSSPNPFGNDPNNRSLVPSSDGNQGRWSASWNDGTTSGQVVREAWSWPSNTPAPVSPPPMLMQGQNMMQIDHSALHRQSLENADQFHQQALQNSQAFHQQAMDVHNSMTANMQNMMQANMQSLMHGMASSHQLAWSSAETPVQQVQSLLPISYQQNIYNHYHLPQAQSPPVQLPAAQYAPSPLGPPREPARMPEVEDDGSHQRLDDMQRRQDATNRAMQKRYEDDQAAARERFRQLEEAQARDRAASEAKDLKLRQLRDKHAASEKDKAELERQRREDAERYAQQMAEMARANAARSKSPPAFEMEALRRVVQETQARQLSPTDIERVVKSTMDKQLSGLATKADVSAGTSHMQQALNNVPSGASQEQVSQVVNQELMNMIKGLTDARQAAQQQRIEAGRQGTPTPCSRQEPPRTVYEIEELSDDEPDPPQAGPNGQNRDVPQTHAIPMPSQQVAQMPGGTALPRSPMQQSSQPPAPRSIVSAAPQPYTDTSQQTAAPSALAVSRHPGLPANHQHGHPAPVQNQNALARTKPAYRTASGGTQPSVTGHAPSTLSPSNALSRIATRAQRPGNAQSPASGTLARSNVSRVPSPMPPTRQNTPQATSTQRQLQINNLRGSLQHLSRHRTSEAPRSPDRILCQPADDTATICRSVSATASTASSCASA